MSIQRLLGNLDEIKNYTIQSYMDSKSLGFIAYVELDWDKVKSDNGHVMMKAGPALNRYLFSNKKGLTFTLENQNKKITLKMSKYYLMDIIHGNKYDGEDDSDAIVENNFELMIMFLKSNYDLTRITFIESSDEMKDTFDPPQAAIDLLVSNSISFRYDMLPGRY